MVDVLEGLMGDGAIRRIDATALAHVIAGAVTNAAARAASRPNAAAAFVAAGETLGLLLDGLEVMEAGTTEGKRWIPIAVEAKAG